MIGEFVGSVRLLVETRHVKSMFYLWSATVSDKFEILRIGKVKKVSLIQNVTRIFRKSEIFALLPIL